MSDLISTPSQAQSIVSNEAFEALVDLLASDGIDENPSTLPRDCARTQPNMTLRDSSGKLDFDQIRLMFAGQNESHRVPTAPEPLGEEESHVQPIEDGDSDDESHSYRSMSSTIPSRSNSMSPNPAERGATCHRRSSTFGNQPWAAIHENATPAKKNVAPTLLHQPLSFNELNTALADAHEEVKNLRQQYDELQALVSKRLGAETRHQVKKFPSAVFLPSDVPTEIASLSENEAKIALSALARSLNLSLSTVSSMASPPTSTAYTPPNQGLSPPIPTRQHDVPSITRAVKFLGTVDELVWRRTSCPSGPRTLLPVFSEENNVALVARLELWERAVRRSLRT